jgi:hypothetical protein
MREEGARMADSRTWLPIETRTCFPTSDGREVVLNRGSVACEVSYSRVPHETTGLDWDCVDCTLTLRDRLGDSFVLRRRIGANSFLELVRTSRNYPPKDMTMMVEGIRCYHDHRVLIPTVGASGDEPVTIAYWAKQLDVVLDLLSYSHGEWEQLALQVHPIAYGGIGGRPTPAVVVGTDWAAKVVLWPGFLSGSRGPEGNQPVFETGGPTGSPQALVEVV